jgi:hypothetical protein
LIVGGLFCTGLEHRSKGIAIVRSRYQEMFCATLRGGKDLVFAAVICELWRSAVTL